MIKKFIPKEVPSMNDHEIKLLIVAQLLTGCIKTIMENYENLCANTATVPSPELQALVEHLSDGVALAISDRPDLQQFLNEIGDLKNLASRLNELDT